MDIEDRKALRRLFAAVQTLLPAAQAWYTQATGVAAVPPEITDLRLALIAPELARAIRDRRE